MFYNSVLVENKNILNDVYGFNIMVSYGNYEKTENNIKLLKNILANNYLSHGDLLLIKRHVEKNYDGLSCIKM